MKSTRVEFESDDSKDEYGKHDKEANLHQGRQSLQDRLQNNLQACRAKKTSLETTRHYRFSSRCKNMSHLVSIGRLTEAPSILKKYFTLNKDQCMVALL